MAATWEHLSPSLQSMSYICKIWLDDRHTVLSRAYPAMYVQYAVTIGPCIGAMIHSSWALSGALWPGFTFAFNSTHLVLPLPNSEDNQFSCSHFESSCSFLAVSRRAAVLACKSQVRKWSRQNMSVFDLRPAGYVWVPFVTCSEHEVIIFEGETQGFQFPSVSGFPFPV